MQPENKRTNPNSWRFAQGNRLASQATDAWCDVDAKLNRPGSDTAAHNMPKPIPRPMTYQEACGSLDGQSTRRLLQNIADGRFWYEGLQFDPPELQAKKAELILQELDAQFAKISDIASLGGRAQEMLLRLGAETKFDKSITKPTE
jgi:hypothetical protein